MLKAILLMSLSFAVTADGMYVFTGINAFDDKGAEPEHVTQSSNGLFGLKYEHDITNKFYMEMGFKHESSIPYKEQGVGINSFFIILNLKVW